jgi:hypothetical protein
LVEEVAFRGYGFQVFSRVVGPVGAAIGFSVFYAILQSQLAGASRSAVVVALVLGLLLSIAYLRTRALWFSWGINFGWKASRGLLFGLTVSGVNSHSPVVQGNPMGPFWLTGGGFGLDGSWFAFLLILAAIPVVYRLTRDLDFQYNVPEVVPGGIAVDIPMPPQPVGTPAQPLVQIQPAPAPVIPAAPAQETSEPAHEEPPTDPNATPNS